MEEYQGDNGNHGNISRGHWKTEEDDLLRNLVECFGPKNWNTIAEHIEGRTGKICRLRWFNQLNPNVNKQPFTEEEETRMLLAQRAHGNKWSAIARHFPGRTDSAVKNHFHVIIGRKRKDPKLSPPYFAATPDNFSMAHTGDYNVGAPGGSNGMITGPTFHKRVRNNFFPGIGTTLNFGDINFSGLIRAVPVGLDGSAAYNNFNADGRGGAFRFSDFGFGTGTVGEVSQATSINIAQHEETCPPFIDFLGTGSKNQADPED